MPTININSNTTLADVLTNDPSTGALNIESPNAENLIICNNTLAALVFSNSGTGESANVGVRTDFAQLDYTGTGASGFVKIDNSKSEVQHDTLIDLDAPNVNLPQETAFLILSTDASKNIKGLSTTTYPSLIELSYVKGVTNAIQTQLDAKLGIVMSFFPAAQFNPGDGVVYYFGTNPSSTVQSAAGFGDAIAPVAFTIKSIYGISYQSAGSNENVVYEIGVNGSYTTISSTVQLTASSVEISVTGLSIAVSAGDNITIRMTSPTWATNPTNMRAAFNVYGI